MRVLAVAQLLQFDKTPVRLAGKQRMGAIRCNAREIVADRAVVLADPVEGAHRQGKPGFVGDPSMVTQFLQNVRVLGRIGQHRDTLPVLRRAAYHGRATDVDVFDGVFQRATGFGHSGFKRVQVDHQEVDGLNAVCRQCRHVGGQAAACQQAAMHLGVEGFDAAIQHLGEAGVVGHLGDRQAVVGQQFGGAARGQQLDAQRMQALGQFNNAGFVGYGKKGVHTLKNKKSRQTPRFAWT